MTSNFVFKKSKCYIGEERDYGPYGIYKKSEDGKWIRLKKGYPDFRRTKTFEELREFLLKKGEEEDYINNFSSNNLKKIIKSRNLNNEFEDWRKEKWQKNTK